MNCLEFRRWLAIEPGSTLAAFAAHGAECARCAEAWLKAQDFERVLAAALAVPVPAGLEERVLLRQTTSRRHERHAERRDAWSRLAAAVVLAVGMATTGFLAWRDSRPLPDAAVAHLSHEPYALSARARVTGDEIAATFARAGVALAGMPAEVNYLQLCHIGRDVTVHMVAQREDGPVTLLFVAGRREEGRSVFARDGLKGRAVPMGDGTLVLLASDDRSFDALENAWSSALGESTDLAYAPPPSSSVMRPVALDARKPDPSG